jgi:hypothetical protein
MRTDVRRCNGHNVIHGLRETCPRCAQEARERVLAKAGAPVRSAWEDVPPPQGIDLGYPESLYAPFASMDHGSRLREDVRQVTLMLRASPSVILPLRRQEDRHEVLMLLSSRGLRGEDYRMAESRRGFLKVSYAEVGRTDEEP